MYSIFAGSGFRAIDLHQVCWPGHAKIMISGPDRDENSLGRDTHIPLTMP